MLIDQPQRRQQHTRQERKEIERPETLQTTRVQSQPVLALMKVVTVVGTQSSES